MPQQAPAPVPDERISDEAAYWCMRLDEPDFSEEERERLNTWLRSDPAHQQEFEAMQDIWTVSDLLPAVAAPQPAAPAASPPPAIRQATRRRWRRPMLAAASLAFALPLAGVLGWNQGWLPDSYDRYQSEGAMRSVTLADGSRVQLNLGTQLTYSNYKDRRSVSLNQGEAYFEVQHDAAHPFVVNAGQGQIRVTGTRFNVWTYEGSVIVTLTEGSVQVSGNRSEAQNSRSLSPGMQASYSPQNSAPQLASASPEQALAWRDGKLIIDDLSLAEALPRLNRYLEKPVHLADTATGQLRIGGIYNTSNIADLIQTLPKVLPVSLSRNTDGETVIARNRR